MTKRKDNLSWLCSNVQTLDETYASKNACVIMIQEQREGRFLISPRLSTDDINICPESKECIQLAVNSGLCLFQGDTNEIFLMLA